MIPVTLSYRLQAVRVEAYVDSGAFYSVFNTEVAQSLSLNPKLGKKIFFTVGDGKKIEAWILKIPLGIGEESFPCEIAFSDELKVGFNLLGRKGIFEYFEEVVFQERKRKILFKY